MGYRALGFTHSQALKYGLILPKKGECLMSQDKRNKLRKKRKNK